MEYIQALYDFSQALKTAPPTYRIGQFRAHCKLPDVEISIDVPRWMSKSRAKQIVAARMLDWLSKASIKYFLSEYFPRADKKAVIEMRERLREMGFPCISDAIPHPQNDALYRLMYEGTAQ